MVQIEFDNNQMITVIQANLQDLFKDVLSKYLGKTKLSPESVVFISNGSIINPNLSVEKQMNNLNKENKTMKVLVNIMKEDDTKKKLLNQKKLYVLLAKNHVELNLKIIR